MIWDQSTIKYKTYLKEVIVDGIYTAWRNHPDNLIQSMVFPENNVDRHISVEFPTTRASYPAIMVGFSERDIGTAGVGHVEWLKIPAPDDQPEKFHAYQHLIYHGSLNLTVYALSSYDRDIVSDALVQTLKFWRTTEDGFAFLDRLYYTEVEEDPYVQEHYINLNLDEVQPSGETQTIAPWMPEDVLVYQSSYSIPTMGEIYSPVPEENEYGLVEHVDIYPYMPADGEERPDPNPDDPAHWTSEGGYFDEI